MDTPTNPQLLFLIGAGAATTGVQTLLHQPWHATRFAAGKNVLEVPLPESDNCPEFVAFEVDDRDAVEVLFVSYVGEGREEWTLKTTLRSQDVGYVLGHPSFKPSLLSKPVRDHLIRCVTESEDALRWANAYPKDRLQMRPFIEGDHDALAWVQRFPHDHDQMLPVMIRYRARIASHYTQSPILFKSAMQMLLETALQWVSRFPRDRGILRRWFNHRVAFETGLADKWLRKYPYDKKYIRLPGDLSKVVALTRPAASGSGKIKIPRTR